MTLKLVHFSASPSKILNKVRMKEELKNQLRRLIKGYLRDLFWAAFGKTLKNPGLSGYPKSILFICKGNICRSPFAEHLGRKMACDAGNGNWVFYSAGLDVSSPSPPPKEAVVAAENFGVELNGHRSRQINQLMLESFDVIITMEVWHSRYMTKHFPQYRNKILLLTLLENNTESKLKGFSRYNIQDPYGRDLDEFHICFRRIEKCIEGLFQEIELGS